MVYAISDQKLCKDGNAVSFRQTPHGGQTLRPRFLVLHYTAGRSFESTLEWFENRTSKASAHLVIGQKGEICQMQTFDKTCYHAGISQWKGTRFLNTCAIGIEMDNAGLLQKKTDAKWTTWFGQEIAQADVLQARHRLGGDICGWQLYTKVQVETCLAIVMALHEHFGFEDIVGHEDISWPRKTDPGPAFPLQDVRAHAFKTGLEIKK